MEPSKMPARGQTFCCDEEAHRKSHTGPGSIMAGATLERRARSMKRAPAR